MYLNKIISVQKPNEEKNAREKKNTANFMKAVMNDVVYIYIANEHVHNNPNGTIE